MASEELIIRINGDAKNFRKALKQASKETEDFEAGLKSAAKISAVAFAGLAAAIGGTVIAAAKMESVQVQFEVLTGSTKKATKAMKELQEFSATTPFQFEDVAKAGTQLLGFGFAAEDLTEKLGQIGDVAAASGSSLTEVALIFGPVEAAGKLTGERLLQFQERAIPIGPAIAKTMGVAVTAVKELVSAGKVSSAQFQAAFASISAEGGQAFQGMVKQSKTLNGLFSTVKDNISLIAAEIGAEFLPAFKEAANILISFFTVIREHPEIAKTAAALLGVGAALTATILSLSLGTLGFLKMRAAVIATTVAFKAMSISIRGVLIATGIGLLIVILTDLLVNWRSRWTQAQAIFEVFVNNMRPLLTGLGKLMLGAFTFNLGLLTSGISDLKTAFTEGFEEFNELVDAKRAERAEAEATKDEEANEEKKEKMIDLAAQEAELEQELFETGLATKEEMDEILRGLDQAARIKKLEALKKEIKTDQQLQEQALKSRLSSQNTANAKFLVDQRKFGAAFAFINRAMHSEVFKGTRQAFGELGALVNSENKTLKKIGKVAAVANIIIRTAESAINIFSGFSAIPIVGFALGIAGAAAAVAFGVEQIGKVNSAQEGGIITGGISGRDSVPALLEPGELVVPRRNFEEVIGAVAGAREGDDFFANEETAGISVMIGFEGDQASEVLTVQQNEDSALGISQEIT